MTASSGLTGLRLACCCQMLAAIAMKNDKAPKAGAKASKSDSQSTQKKRAALKKEGGGGAKVQKPRRTRLDSASEKKSQIAVIGSPADSLPHVGSIYIGKRTIATIQAPSQDDYQKAKDIVEAGFRVKREAESWGMNPDDYRQLHPFPSDHDDWKVRMERLASHSLHDDDASEMASLMHACTWTLVPLWNWMHHLAENAANTNIKREAGRTLGALYHEARQKKNRIRLGNVNEEFERQVAPFGGIKVKPSAELQQWVSNRMRHCMEFWKRAIEVAVRFDNMKTPDKAHAFARVTAANGYRYDERLPMNTMADAWKGYFIEERTKRQPSESFSKFLNELESHPFCTRGLNLAKLTDFEQCWKLALYDWVKSEWKSDKQTPAKQRNDKSFVHKFGDLKNRPSDQGAGGYTVARDYFNYLFVSHWENKKVNDARFWASFNGRKTGTATAAEPTATQILALSKRKKSRIG